MDMSTWNKVVGYLWIGDGMFPGGRLLRPRIQPAHARAGSRGRHVPRRSPEVEALGQGILRAAMGSAGAPSVRLVYTPCKPTVH